MLVGMKDKLEMVSFRLPKTLTQKLRVHAAVVQKPMQEIVRTAIEMFMKRDQRA
jgi:predicted DNA-binding protein